LISRRIIPLFLLRGKRLVKGTNFKDFVDVGDPISQAMIYDAQGADEIIVVDVESSTKGRIINTEIINGMIKKCFNAGADKIVINTYAVLRTALIRELADEFGSQSVVVSIDIKKNKKGNYEIYVFSGKQKVDIDIYSYIAKVIECGAGEILITSIDKEGTLLGFDYELFSKLREIIPVPLIASGGAGCYDDMVKLFDETDSDACAIGKMLFLRDYDIVRIKSYLRGRKVSVREA